jgi:hypothetical protein
MLRKITKVIFGLFALSLACRFIVGADFIVIGEIKCFDAQVSGPPKVVNGIRYVGCPVEEQNSLRYPLWFRFLTGGPL